MDSKLFVQAIVKYLSGIILLGVLLFLPAGTFDWWQAWLFLGILFIPMGIAGFFMMAKAPDLLRKRLSVLCHLLLICLELRLQCLAQTYRLCGDGVHKRSALDAGEYCLIELLCKLLII